MSFSRTFTGLTNASGGHQTHHTTNVLSRLALPAQSGVWDWDRQQRLGLLVAVAMMVAVAMTVPVAVAEWIRLEGIPELVTMPVSELIVLVMMEIHNSTFVVVMLFLTPYLFHF